MYVKLNNVILSLLYDKSNMIIEIIISELDFYIIEKVRELRIKAEPRVDQVELAQRLGVSEGYVGSIENPRIKAKYNIRMLGKIAKAFNLKSYQELFPEKVLANDIVKIKLHLIKTSSRKHEADENGEITKRFIVLSIIPMLDEELELWKLNKIKYLTVVK